MADQLHHYIPRFLLRRFGSDTGVLHVMDKHSGRRFSVSTSKKSRLAVAAERGMYEFDFAGVPMTVEPALAALESEAAVIIDGIVRAEKLDHADRNQRGTLARFLAVQLVRTRAVWATQQDIFKRMEAWLRREGAPEDFFEPDPYVGERENAEKAIRARMICNAAADYGLMIAEKDWVLLKTEENAPYLIGDHPFAMFNDVDHSPRGNLGLKVKGIQLYFPLSRTLALGLWCPSHQQFLLDGFRRLDALSEKSPGLVRPYLDAWRDGIRIVEAIQRGTPISSKPENVLHFNSLQVSTAEQFVFSPDGDFTLVEEMIRENPELRIGHRLEEATGKF
jgi:hypothetical protein